MRRALESLPWASKASVNFSKRTASVTVVADQYSEAALVKALKSAGFGGSVKGPKAKPVASVAHVAFHVTGLKKDLKKDPKKAASGPSSTGETNRVTRALKATKSTTSIEWDYGTDTVTIAYNPKTTSPKKLAAIIKGLKYGADEVPVKAKPNSKDLVNAFLPADAPKEFAKAFRSARTAKKPILIDFWSPRCAPCVKLKKVTLHDPAVVKALEGVEVIFVNVDEHPDLAKSYGVETIPNLFFINNEGKIVERLKSFEKAQPFIRRIQSAKAKPTKPR